MSVIRSDLNEPEIKVAFCGCMGSGKTYASNLLQLKTNARIMSIAQPIKDIVSVMNLKAPGRGEHIMVGTVGRSLDNRVWIDQLVERAQGDVIVDDVRFENEARILKENNFTIIFLDVPWYVRFQRVMERSEDLRDHIQYFGDATESAPERIDKRYFDYICKTEADVERVIEEITSSDVSPK